MTPLHITATTIVSALGSGEAATLAALRAGRTGLTPADFEDTPGHGFIGRVAGLDTWQLPGERQAFQCRNNAIADMALRNAEFRDEVEAAARRYGSHRIATVIGTSTSAICPRKMPIARATLPPGRCPPRFPMITATISIR